MSHQQQQQQMDESFHFSLLRISISQILKASGFDKIKPSTLNIITDLYIKYFEKLVNECMKCSQLRTNSNRVELQDVTQGLINSGSIIPRNFIRKNDRESHNYNTKSLKSFIDWIKYSDSFQTTRKLNTLPSTLVTNLIEKRKLDLNDGETDQEKKKRKYKEKQEFYNQLKLNELEKDGVNPGNTNNPDLDLDDVITDNDKLKWLNYLIEKDLKLGHNLKFFNSSLQSEFQKFENNLKFHPNNKKDNSNDSKKFIASSENVNKNDYILLNIESDDYDESTPQIKPSDELLSTLPYKISYSPHLLHDIDENDFIDINENVTEEKVGMEDVENEKVGMEDVENEKVGMEDVMENEEGSVDRIEAEKEDIAEIANGVEETSEHEDIEEEKIMDEAEKEDIAEIANGVEETSGHDDIEEQKIMDEAEETGDGGKESDKITEVENGTENSGVENGTEDSGVDEEKKTSEINEIEETTENEVVEEEKAIENGVETTGNEVVEEEKAIENGVGTTGNEVVEEEKVIENGVEETGYENKK